MSWDHGDPDSCRLKWTLGKWTHDGHTRAVGLSFLLTMTKQVPRRREWLAGWAASRGVFSSNKPATAHDEPAQRANK